MIENLPVHAGPTMSHSRSMQILDQHMSSSSWTVRLAGLPPGSRAALWMSDCFSGPLKVN